MKIHSYTPFTAAWSAVMHQPLCGVRRHIGTALAALAFTLAPMMPASATPGVPGSLDTSFGSGGSTITAVGSSPSIVESITMQPDGKIVALGRCLVGGIDNFCLARYQGNGTLDASFGTAGTVSTLIGTFSRGASVALQSDGKIVAAGACAGNGVSHFCVARYLASGLLDAGFGTAGTLSTPMDTFVARGQSVALQPNGKIVVAGTCGTLGATSFCLVRFDANGALDSGFGVAGKLSTLIGNSSEGFSVALQPDGKIVVGGTCRIINQLVFCLARYLANGTLDTSFGTAGKRTTPIGSYATLRSIALQPSGQIVAAGECTVNSATEFCVVLYQPNSNIEIVRTLLLGRQANGYSVAIQPDGRIVVAGACFIDGDLFTSLSCLVRLRADLGSDSSFGTAGSVSTLIGQSSSATSVVLQPDGKIVVAGSCSEGGNFKFCLARFEGGPSGAQFCSLDIDGDGRVNATTDTLILNRIALGINTSAAIAGISFPATATRNTWPLIRDYLVSNCGLVLLP